MDAATAQRLPEWLCDLVLTLDLSKTAGPVPAVEGQRSPWPGGVRRALRVTGTGGVACHDLILAEAEDPPHTRQSPRTLAAFRPWGSWRDERRARGLAVSLAMAGSRARPIPAQSPARPRPGA